MVTQIYAAWHQENKIRNTCASGGVFYAMAEKVIASQGVVIGAAFDENLHVRHTAAEDLETLEKLKRSKYVQSDLSGIFQKTKELLEQGKTVLFSGTPCQTQALKRFLGKEYSTLILCALFCYGTPERQVYEKYLAYLEEKENSKISSINFKDKRYGWDYYTTEIHFENGKTLCRFGGDSYRRLMGLGYSLCTPCLSCNLDFRNTEADIMLGDFYTYSHYIDIVPPKSGISCVIIRSENGEKLFGGVKYLEKIEIDSESFFNNEKQKKRNFDMERRSYFHSVLNNEGYAKACRAVGVSDRPLTGKQIVQAIRKRLSR